MNNDDGLFDLRQVEAITRDLRTLCQDLSDRLYSRDPAAALEFADELRSRRISADTFIELFHDNLIQRLDPSVKSKTILINDLNRRTH